jgi:predicted signal transduction protein with EAL and GGDEF domain
VTLQESLIVISGLGLIAFLSAQGVPLQIAVVVTVSVVALLVVLVVAPRELLEMVRLLREIRRLGLEERRDR